jgi:Ca2+-binding RTX toxin-like protein
MPIPTKLAATSAVLAAALLSGGLASSASAAPPPYKVKTTHRTLTIRARDAGANLVLLLAPGDPQTLEVDVGGDGSADYSIARSRFDRILIAAGSGSNRVGIDELNGPFTTTTPTTIDGQGGDDELLSGSGNETLLGGDGSDFIDAGRGADVVDTGAGDDTFLWNPGEGSDTFEGGAGNDTMLFNGAAAAEQFVVLAQGSRVHFTRDLGGIVMDLHGVEGIKTNAIAGADHFSVGNLTGTDVTNIEVNLGAVDGGFEGANDQVTIGGTGANDAITAGGTSTGVTVGGLAARVDISGAQLTDDTLEILGGGGDDVINGSDLTADAIRFHADGGAGNDVLTGGDGDDTLVGGDGDDVRTAPRRAQLRVAPTAPRTLSISAARIRSGGMRPAVSSPLAAWITARIIDRCHDAGTSARNDPSR